MEFSTRGMKVKLQTTSSNRNADQFTIDSKNLTLRHSILSLKGSGQFIQVYGKMSKAKELYCQS